MNEIQHLRAGLKLFERHAALDAADALLTATAATADVDAFVSADVASAAVPKLRHVAPGTEAFDQLLRA